jgi:DNA-binding transcriptional LysR family regulator
MGCAPDVPLQRLQAFLGLIYERGVKGEAGVVHMPSEEQVWRLRDGDLDLGLFHDTGNGTGLERERIYRGEPLVAVVSLGHRAAGSETVRLQDLAGDVLLVVRRSAEPGLHERVITAATSDGAAFRAIREAPGPDIRDLLFAVASGHGVTLAPRSVLRCVGDLGTAVVTRPLQALALMPDTIVAWPIQVRHELGGMYASARSVARELYGF